MTNKLNTAQQRLKALEGSPISDLLQMQMQGINHVSMPADVLTKPKEDKARDKKIA